MLDRVNKFNPRCVEAQFLGSCLRSSRHVVVDFDGRFRLVRTVKRGSSDDRWTGVQSRDFYSVGDLEMTPAEFTCSRGTRGEVNPAAQRLERQPADVLPPNPDHDPVPRRLYLKQKDFLAHGTSDHCPGCRALVSGGRAQGHTEDCRIRVEGERRKTKEESGRLPAAATRVGDAATRRELKRVPLAGDRVENSAQMPTGPQSVSASSTLPPEIASSSPEPAFPAESVPSTSATDVPDQVTSEGASSSSNMVVKRSGDARSSSESGAKRLHADHSMLIQNSVWESVGVGKSVEIEGRFFSTLGL